MPSTDTSTNWQTRHEQFEAFLRNLPLENYAPLRKIKTVEQDLPRPLIPLDLFYALYWENEADFPPYEEAFARYWEERRCPHITDFIEKYFYGCSVEFVKEGLRARLYRIWLSVLTQFQFQYLWNALFPNLPLESTAELDQAGIDAKVTINGIAVGLQVKKVSYRREVSSRRFTQRQQRLVSVLAEIPYLVINAEKLEQQLESPRVKPESKEKKRRLLKEFYENFVKYPNGFVAFKKEYVKRICQILEEKIPSAKAGSTIPYKTFLDF